MPHPIRAMTLGLFLICAPDLADAQAPSWTLDPSASNLTFTGTQMGGRFEGRFGDFAADIRFEPNAPDIGKVEVTIRTASIDTGGGDRDRTVLGKDFFNTAEFPTASFKVGGFEPTADGAYKAIGSLTMKGTTQPVELPVTVAFAGEPGFRTARAAGELTISRLDYKIGDGQWKDISVVGEMVTIRFDITAVEAR